MKRVLFCITIFVFFSTNTFAAIRDGFFVKPFASIEYSAPSVENAGTTSDNIKTDSIGKQLTNAENIALGGNFRIHKFIGLNANWTKTSLSSSSLEDIAISRRANFKLTQMNFSVLGYFPVIDDQFEVFAEAGVADINTKITYTQTNNIIVSRQAHETMGIYGLGFQITPFENSDDTIRFSYQRYSGKLALLDGYYSTVRLGYLKSF